MIIGYRSQDHGPRRKRCRRALLATSTLLSVAVGGAAHAACTSPIGSPGEWTSGERQGYVTCIVQQGDRARANTYGAINERRSFDAVNRALFGWATDRL